MSSTHKELFSALNRAQASVGKLLKDSTNPHFKSKYADLASVWETIREPFTKEGLSIVQLLTAGSPGTIGIRTVLAHSSGESIEDVFHVPCAKPNDPQALGSAVTYGRRYSLMALCGIAPEDDDGTAAAPGKPRAASPSVDWTPQVKEILKALSVATDEGQRQLYASVRNDTAMPAAVKNDLLAQMKVIIKDRMNKNTKGTK